MQKRASTLATLILPISRALRLAGAEPMELLEQAGIDPAMVINADRRVPIPTMQDFWGLALEATGDEAFGLLAAAQLQPATLQGLGLAMLTSDTVYDALQRLERFSRVLSTGLTMQMVERDEYVDLELFADEIDFGHDIHWASYDFAMGVVVELCRLTLGDYVSPIHMECQRPTPQDPDRFASLVGSQLKFNAQHNRIVFVKADIVDRLITANPDLARVNDEQTETYLASYLDVTASREVVGKIIEHLPDGPPSQKEIAGAMNVSNRTLQRKLKDEGTSFIDLLQDARLGLAKKYLSQPQRSIVEIAYLLGFSEPSTFSRAFKRWTGQAPIDYRESHIAAAPVEHQ
ncbi:MAG: AraC family transcriptional regulator [Halieaceae bacterium]